MLLLSVLGVGLIFLYSHLIDKRLPYRKAYWYFEGAHLLVGFFIAAGVAEVIPNKWVVFEVTMAIGLMWEIWELMLERPFLTRLFSRLGWRHGPWTLSDTIFDLLLDAVGVGAFLVFLR